MRCEPKGNQSHPLMNLVNEPHDLVLMGIVNQLKEFELAISSGGISSSITLHHACDIQILTYILYGGTPLPSRMNDLTGITGRT